jgi:hypothetical protein
MITRATKANLQAQDYGPAAAVVQFPSPARAVLRCRLCPLLESAVAIAVHKHAMTKK